MAKKTGRIERYVLKPEQAERIAAEIIEDICGRGVLGDVWWREVQPGDKEAMKAAWAQIIRKYVNHFGRLATAPRPKLTMAEAKEILTSVN